MQGERFFITADSKDLECLRLVNRCGDGAARDKTGIVFLHEGLGSIDMWRGFPQVLCDRLGLPGFVYCRAGHGASAPCDLPRPVSYMHHEAQVVLPEILAAAGFEKVLLVGHSDGGSIALIHAGSVESTPVAGLVTLAAHVFNEPVSIASIAAARQGYVKGDLRARLIKYHGENVDNCFYGWNDVWLSPGFADWNIERVLPNISQPLLVLQGADDEYGTRAQVSAICKGVSGPVQSVILDDCRHSPHLQQPEETLDEIAKFMAA